MNILLCVSSLNAGGAERVATTLCNAWAARGDSVLLLPTFSGGGASFYTIDSNVDVVYLASVVGLESRSVRKSYLKRLLALRNIVVSNSPDVIVAFLPNVNVAAILAAAFTRIPVVICERSDPSMMPMSRIWRLACNATYRFSNMLTVQTESVKQSIHSIYGGLNQVSVVHNPLPEAVVKYRADLASQKDRRVLLSLGRLTKEKRVVEIVAAFADVECKFSDWDLHIYGDGPDRDLVEAEILRQGLSDRIFLRGSTSSPWSVMAKADAFVMNSVFEGFPNALLEAMGVGLPCITSDCPSGPREISRNGKDALLVTSGDSSALRGALVQLMENPDFRVDLGARARESVIYRYSLDKVISDWDGIFRQVGAIR